LGEAKRRLSTTARFIAEHPLCCLCGGERAADTREHMPPKSLFDSSLRPNRLVMPACSSCNRGTSTSDLTASLVSRWDYSVSSQSNIDHAKLARQVRIQAPELLAEWTNATGVRKKQARRHLERHGIAVPLDASIVTIGPKTVRQLNIFAHKVVLALYFEHFRTHLTNDGRIAAYWRTKEDYAAGVPRGLLDLMPQYGTLIQGTWNTADIFEYRYDTGAGGLLGFIARFRSGLFITGFVVESFEKVPDNMGDDWIVPKQLLGENPQFDRTK
jgi:hypothetical protein